MGVEEEERGNQRKKEEEKEEKQILLEVAVESPSLQEGEEVGLQEEPL